MSFLKKVLPFVLAALVVSTGAFIFGRANKPEAPIKVYKATLAPSKTRTSQKTVIPVGTQTVETPESQTDHPNDSSIVSEKPQTEEGIIDEVDDSHTLNMEDLSDTEDSDGTPQLSAEELRRQELLRRQADIHEELKALSPGGPVHSADNPQNVLQALTLIKELTLIDEELNGQNNTDILRYIQRGINTTQSLTPDGKMPITAAAQLADSWEKDGNFEGARIMRMAIQNALKNGDEVLKEEHIEEIQ